MTGGYRQQRRLFDRKPVASLREIVRDKIAGLEVRQAARVERRRATRPPAQPAPVQPDLWGAA